MLLDNKARGKVGDVLTERLAAGARLSMLSNGRRLFKVRLISDGQAGSSVQADRLAAA